MQDDMEENAGWILMEEDASLEWNQNPLKFQRSQYKVKQSRRSWRGVRDFPLGSDLGRGVLLGC